MILRFYLPQHRRAAGDEAWLVHLHRPLCSTGTIGVESGPHCHLPALYKGEKNMRRYLCARDVSGVSFLNFVALKSKL